MTTQNQWGEQLRKFRLAGGYSSQGIFVNAASTLITSLSPTQFNTLLSAFNVDEGTFDISQTMLSRWETGARKPPRERNRHLGIIWVLAQLACVDTRTQADEWLSMADLKPLTGEEYLLIWPTANESSQNLSPQTLNTIQKSESPSRQDVQPHPKIIDWGEAPRVDFFYGRAEEQHHIQSWLIQDKCQVIGIWGMGGQGKTTLTAKIIREVVDEFDGVIWRSLLNAPPLDEMLSSWIQTLSDKRLFQLPTNLNERLLLLFELLSRKRYLLVLDNVESILEADDSLGRYRTGYEPYGQLLLRFGETTHKSCLLLTSREEPREFTRLRSQKNNATAQMVQTLRLEGLDLAASESLMLDDIVNGSSSSIQELGRRYSGHPLALMLVSRSIVEFYGGDIDLFLEQEPELFGDIQELLKGHIRRITESELSILYWLAIEREAISTLTLRENVVLSTEQSQLMASLRSLQRRSLIENHPDPESQLARFTVQNVVMEYLTERILQEVVTDLLSEELGDKKWWGQSFLYFHALVKVTGKSYIRASQERLLLQPLAHALLNRLGRKKLREVLIKRLNDLRNSGITVGYTAGNILNLLLCLEEDLTDLNFSQLPVWQAALDAQQLQNVNFAGADLSDSVFYENFIRIISLSFHPSGSLIFVGTTHGQLGVYEMPNLRAVEKHSGPVQHISALEVSGNGQMLVSSGFDGIAYVWDIVPPSGSEGDLSRRGQSHTEQSHTGQSNRKTERGHTLKPRYHIEETDRVRAVSFCVNDTVIALGYADKIRLHNANTGELLATLSNCIKSIYRLAYVPQKNILISAGWDNCIFFWQLDPLATEPIASLPALPADLSNLDVSPDGNLLAAACFDGSIYLWSISEICTNISTTIQSKPKPLMTLTGHTGKINQVSFSPTAQLLASCSVDRTVRIWDLDSGRTKHLLNGHHDEIDALKFSPDGTNLVSSGSDRTLRLWDPRIGKEVRILGSYAGGSSSGIEFSPDSQSLVNGSDNGTVRVWDLSTHKCKHVLKRQTNHIFDIAWSPCGTTFASASLDQTICVWNANTGQLLYKLTDHNGEVTSVTYHPTLPLLASSSNDRTIRLWNSQTGISQHTWHCPGGAVWSVQISPEGNTIAAGSTSGVIYIWELESKQIILELSHLEDLAWSVAYSPDGRYLAGAGYEGKICLWDLKHGTLQQEWIHGTVVRKLIFSPDSQQIVSVGDNQEICLWDIESSRERYRIFGKDGVDFSADGQLIASGADEWSIQLLHAATGQLAKRLQIENSFHGTNITDVRGISPAQIETLKSMGAVDEQDPAL